MKPEAICVDEMHFSAIGVTFRRPICIHGHDKRIVGIFAGRKCRECAAESERRNSGKGRTLTNPICRNGHDKRIVGVKAHKNRCAECARISNRRSQRKKRSVLYGVPVELVGRVENPLRLGKVRESLGLSRENLSRISGVSRETIWDIETGRRKGWPKTRKKLVDAIAIVMAKRRGKITKGTNR